MARGAADLSLSPGYVTHACKKIDRKNPSQTASVILVLTGAFVEFACLCDIPFAQSGSLANRWSHSVHIIAWQDGVQENAPVIQEERLMLMLHETRPACAQSW